MPDPRRHGHVPIPRRLRRNRSAEVVDGSGVVASVEPGTALPATADAGDAETAARTDMQVALTRPEVEALIRQVQRSTAADHAWPATPDRLRSAVEGALGHDLAEGSVLVTRLPRALHSSESWHVRLVGVSPEACDRLTRIVRSVRLAAPMPSAGSGDVR